MNSSRPSGVCPALRKAAMKLKMKKVIEEKGELCCIKTVSALRDYVFSFTVGLQFDEVTKGLDNQRLKVTAGCLCLQKRTMMMRLMMMVMMRWMRWTMRWVMMVFLLRCKNGQKADTYCCCVSSCCPSLQSTVTWDGDRLVCEQIGLKRNRGWAHWIEDDKLHLVKFI